jgi:hypothetical protein
MIELGVLWFARLFLGAISLVLAFAVLRKAPRPSAPTRGVASDTAPG